MTVDEEAQILSAVTVRGRTALLIALVVASVVASAAGAAPNASRPPGSPDLAAMSLAVSDFPAGTRVDSQGYKRDPDFVASYEREFEVRGGRLGRTRLIGAYESLDVVRTPAAAQQEFALLAALLRGKQGVSLFRAIFAEEGIDSKDIRVGKIRRPKIGHGTLVVPLRLRVSGLWFPFELAFLRFDRVLVGIGLFGMPGGKVFPADTDRLARVAVARIRAGLAPVNTLAPALTGVAQPGQALSVSRGTWTGDQLAFTYQWERCDTAGAGCVAISGATGTSYTLATGDLASTVRVTVTGTNLLGSATSSSAPTAVVAGPSGSPTSTVLPVISGTPAVGGTLTADTGTWAGAPTAFAYQWRRCDASGGACLDLAGATAATYTVAAGDSRSTLRVLVIATSSVGSGGAISAPTAAVP